MLLVLCDKCGTDCERNAYEIRVSSIHNPCPLYPLDVGDLKITCEHKSYRFVLCQDCYRKMEFPNYYKVIRDNELTFRDFEVEEDG